MSDEPNPPRKQYGFKDREFKRDNRRASSVPPMPTAQDLAKLAGGPVVSGPPKNTPKADDPNDVHAVLAANLAVEQKLGGNEIVIKQVSNRRRRDYWIVFGAIELVGGTVVAAGIKQHNPVVIVFGLAGMVFFGLAITWIMFQIVEKY